MQWKPKLSLSHWRYRLLHFTFGVKTTRGDIDKAKEDGSRSVNGLPLYLYKHYCPLFWLTNLFALYFPLLVLGKAFLWTVVPVLKVLLTVVVAVGAPIAGFIGAKFEKSRESHQKNPENLRLQFIKFLKRNYTEENLLESHNYRNIFLNNYGVSEEDFPLEVAQELYTKFLAARNTPKEKSSDTAILVLLRFAEWFVKGVAVVVATFCAFCVLWVLWQIGGLILWAFPHVFSWAGLEVFLSVITFFLIILFVSTIIVFILIKMKDNGVFEWLYDMVMAPFVWMGKATNGLSHFISMFYMENCPKIELVSEEEELLS